MTSVIAAHVESPAAQITRRRLVGMTQSAFDPASRVRFIQYIPTFEKAGWEIDFRPNRPDRQWHSSLPTRIVRALHYRAGRAVMKGRRLVDIVHTRDADVVFVNRDLASGRSFFERTLLRYNRRVVFDFDDAIYLSRQAERRVRWMCEQSAWVTPGNAYLADFARPYARRLTVVPTVIDTDKYMQRDWSADQRARVRVGWTGSNQSIGTTLFAYLPLLARAQRAHDFDLVIITNSRPDINLPGLRWTFIPWTAEDEGTLGSVFDIGIMPLVDDEMQRGKCGLKLLQCMAAGIPTVASPVGVNREIMLDGETGYSAESEEAWTDALGALVRDPDLRARLGRAGRDRCERHYSIRAWAPTLLDILEKVAGERS